LAGALWVTRTGRSGEAGTVAGVSDLDSDISQS